MVNSNAKSRFKMNKLEISKEKRKNLPNKKLQQMP